MVNFFTILAAVMAVFDAFVWFCGFRALRRRSTWRTLRWLFSAFMLFQAAAFVGLIWAIGSGVHTERLFPTPVIIATYLWHLLVLPVALFWNFGALVVEGALAFGKLISSWNRPRPQPEFPDAATESEPRSPIGTPISRRDFIGATAALSPPLLSLAVSAMAAEQLQNFRTRRVELPVHGLPRELHGLTITQVSDTHVGRFTHGKVMQKVADVTNALGADLVVFTGDLINDSLDWLPASIEMLKKIDAPLFMCEGNHDLIESGHFFRTRVKGAGLQLLVNETAVVNLRGCPVQLLGLPWSGPDHGTNNEDLLDRYSSLLALHRDASAFPIVLAHHPHAWDHLAQLPLILSGHTHGGQLMLNERLGVGPILFRYWTGLYTRGRSTLFVSNGVGNWFPLRTAAPAEIVHFTLRSVV
jgi:predicted MPP superfamily phosphohydrolase